MQRRRLTETQRVEIWERLASGEPAPAVARAYGCFPNAIRQMQLLTGGAKPRTRTQRSGSGPARVRARPLGHHLQALHPLPAAKSSASTSPSSASSPASHR